MISNPDIIPSDNALKASTLTLSSRGTESVTTIFDFLNSVDSSGLSVSQRLQSSHVLPMLVTLIVIVGLLIITRLVRSACMHVQ